MFFYNTDADRQEMLAKIGAASIEEIFNDQIPADLQLGRPLNIPPVLSELELTQHMSALAAKNLNAQNATCFLGGGSYDHFIPAAVDALASRGEFYTSYTPYQPEVSQGNLQVMFEYQTLICQLTGMDVSNASLYDGGSAAVEGLLLCIASTGKRKVVTSTAVHPEYRAIADTYFESIDAELVEVPQQNGLTPVDALVAAIDADTACVLLQQPNFFGSVEDLETLTKAAKEKGTLVVLAFDPISLGILKKPGEFGVDVVVAEGQGLGNPLVYGGPYLGIMACREEFVRKMPGRIAGQTTATGADRCWVLTLQTREQHIRRDKATSNICTNQGLFALRAAIYLSLVGPQGLREVATNSLHAARYAAERIAASERFEIAFTSPTFKEFVVRDTAGKVPQLLAHARSKGVLAGLELGRWYEDLRDCFLVAVTEKRTREEIDRWAAVLNEAPANSSPINSGETAHV